MSSEKHLIADVKGMHCASCSSRIENVLSRMAGVQEASVNLASETLSLKYCEPESTLEQISQKVKDLGFQLIPREQDQGELRLKISGMHCGSCSARIERVVGNLPGVKEASVNLATETAFFSFDRDICLSRQIKEAISTLGFGFEISSPELERHKNKEKEEFENLRRMKKNVIFEFVFLLPLLIISMGEMVGLQLPEGISPHANPLRFALIQLCLTLPIMWLGRQFYLIGFPALLRRSPNMDSLIAIGTGAAFVYSVWNLIEIIAGVDSVAKSMDLYFETVGVLITLVSFGKYLENRSKHHTSDAIRSIMNLAPQTAELLKDGEQQTISTDEIEIGDILVIRPGASIPTDGKIIKGETSIDESMMTGESMPASKQQDDKVFGGTVNIGGTINIQAEQTNENTLLAAIVRMVREAQGSKAPIAKIADRVSYYFVPTVMVFAVIVGVLWFFVGDVGFSQSLRFFIAVIVIACPCAMGLATPISIMVGTGRGAQLGILIKNGETLEKLEKVTALIFDKTGTVTHGIPKVVHFEATDIAKFDEYLQLIASTEQSSEHPLANAVVQFAKDKGLQLRQPDSFTAYPGRGVTGVFDDTVVNIGNAKFLEEKNISCAEFSNKTKDFSEEGKTTLFFAIDKACTGIIVIADSLKNEAKSIVEKLGQSGRKVVMLTGDNEKTAHAVAKQAGIATIFADVMPDEKGDVVEKYQQKDDVVAMVGDGINDAPALAKADVGIAMGTGIDIAMESADVVIMRGNLDGVVKALNLSQEVMKNIRQNLFWAFGYNVLGIPIAAGILYIFGGPALNPMLAGAAMALSSVSVVFNALRLRFIEG